MPKQIVSAELTRLEAVIERGLATEWVRGLAADANQEISATGSRKENQA